LVSFQHRPLNRELSLVCIGRGRNRAWPRSWWRWHHRTRLCPRHDLHAAAIAVGIAIARSWSRDKYRYDSGQRYDCHPYEG
jgi:hypothetical protein